MAGAPNRRPSERREEEEESLGSMVATIGLGIGAVLGAGYLLSRLFVSDREEEEPSVPSPTRQAIMGTDRYMIQDESAAILQSSRVTPLIALQSIMSKIKLQKDQIFERNQLLQNIIRVSIIDGLCESSPLFNKLYQCILWTGSFYEGLKNDEPDEYDLNIVLALPVKYSDLIVTTKGAPTAYVCIANFAQALENMKDNQNPFYESIYSKMEEWCDEKGCLKQDKIRYWLQSLLDRYFARNKERIIREFGLVDVYLKESGPARTLVITLKGNKAISIDLVPAIEFRVVGKDVTPLPFPFRRLPDYNLPWYAVPKPKDSRNSVWRLSFCLYEKQMILAVGCVKPAIRLLKKMRDTQLWTQICSYFIKTVAFWELHINRQLINSMTLDQLFLHLLCKLYTRVENNTLQSYWDPRYNLLDGVSDHHRQQIANSMRRVIDRLERAYQTNPELIPQFIVPQVMYHAPNF